MNKPKQEDILVKYKNYTEKLAGIVKEKGSIYFLETELENQQLKRSIIIL